MKAIVLTHLLLRLRQEILNCPLHCIHSRALGRKGLKGKLTYYPLTLEPSAAPASGVVAASPRTNFEGSNHLSLLCAVMSGWGRTLRGVCGDAGRGGGAGWGVGVMSECW